MKIVINALALAAIVSNIGLWSINSSLRMENNTLKKGYQHALSEAHKLRTQLEQKALQANVLPQYGPPNPGKNNLVYTYTN